MQKSHVRNNLSSYDEIFSTEESRADDQREKVIQLPIDSLIPFQNHPFRVVDNEDMKKIIESIQALGVVEPLIAREIGDGQYEIISGHRRQYAAQQAGIETLPVIIRNLDDDAATILMVDSNLHREEILPSERAFAYKMKLDAIKHQGKKIERTSSQVGMKLQAMDIVGEELGDSRNQVHRYIRLTNLIPELLEMVDTKQIGMNPAVELSFLKPDEQRIVLDAMGYSQNTPSLSQAQRLKKLSAVGQCTTENTIDILDEIKKGDEERVTFKGSELRKYFPKNYTPQQIQQTIIKLLDQWQLKRQRGQER